MGLYEGYIGIRPGILWVKGYYPSNAESNGKGNRI